MPQQSRVLNSPAGAGWSWPWWRGQLHDLARDFLLPQALFWGLFLLWLLLGATAGWVIGTLAVVFLGYSARALLS